MGRKAILVLWVLIVLAGCQTTDQGVLSIPVARDYREIQAPDFEAAAASVAQARRACAQHHDPYNYYSAVHYLDIATERKAVGDSSGFADYAGLAKAMAEAAIRKGAKVEDKGPVPETETEQSCRAEFERLRTRYQELERDKAIEVSPAIYAQLTAAMSLAERELVRGEWEAAGRAMATVEDDIDTLWSQDVDEDGVCDMNDGAPAGPEDRDDFQDADGTPDLDNDEDGVPDTVDIEPNEPETHNRWHDEDGAPDTYPVLETIRLSGANARLSDEARGYLRGIAELLVEWPELKLHLNGSASEFQSETQCLDCARACAEKVRAYLLENGVSQSQFVVTFQSGEAPASQDSRAIGRGTASVELTLE